MSSCVLTGKGKKQRENLQDVIPGPWCLVSVIVKASANYILLIKFSQDNQIVLLKQPELRTLVFFLLIFSSLPVSPAPTCRHSVIFPFAYPFLVNPAASSEESERASAGWFSVQWK